MNRCHVQSLFGQKKITASKRDALLRLLDQGVDDPCTSGVSPALAKLWYANLPPSKGRGVAISDVRDILLSERKTQSHYTVASRLQSMSTCGKLNDYLKPWLAATRSPLVLEAVSWKWLVAAGAVDDTSGDDLSTPPKLSDAEGDPKRLVKTLIEFKNHFKLWSLKPMRLTDELALALGWWEEGSESRHDAFVIGTVEELLAEDEWVSDAAIEAHVERTSALSGEEVQRALSRMARAATLVKLGDDEGRYTTPTIYRTSEAVKSLAKESAASALPAWAENEAYKSKAGTLTEEQRSVLECVAGGNRVTLCCSPAGTGKTHTARVVAQCLEEGAGGATEEEEEEEGDVADDGKGAPRVLCLAPTWKAISVLRAKMGLRNVEYMTAQAFVLQPIAPYAKLVLVDETSMLTMFHVMKILRAYVRRSTRVLFLGDDVQIPCIGRGNPIVDIQAVVHTARLTKCMRTEGETLLKVAHAVRTGVAASLLAAAEDLGEEVSVHPMHDASLWPSRESLFHPDGHLRLPWEDGYVQMISPQNRHVDALNEAAQKIVHEGKGVTPASSFSKCYVGDAVRCVENSDAYKNGDEGVLLSVVDGGAGGSRAAPGGKRSRQGGKAWSAKRGSVRLKDGSVVGVSEKHIVPAYATTVHKVQGSEYDTVVMALFEDTHPNLKSREMLYTSVTRARRALRLVGALHTLKDFTAKPRRTVFGFLP